MNFEFDEDERQLSDAVQRWAERAYDWPRRRAIAAAGGFSPQAWQELGELGVLALGLDDASGGLGLGPVAAMLAHEALGRALVLEPVGAVAHVAATLLACAGDSAWTARIAAGEALVAPALQERHARYRLSHVETAARPQAGGWTLHGAKSLVPAGDHADAFLVPARADPATGVDDPAGIGVFLVERSTPGVQTRGYVLQDASRAAEVRFDSAAARLLLPPGTAWPALELAVDHGIAVLGAQAVGAMDRLFEMTVQYMNSRHQFGVPIGTFQALRHRMADMKMQLELGRSMSYYATLKLAEPEPARRRAVSQAKVQLGQSMRFIGQQAIQLHGGIGVTDEYPASHYFKRLTTMELQFGDTLHHLGEVSARMQDSAGVFA